MGDERLERAAYNYFLGDYFHDGNTFGSGSSSCDTVGNKRGKLPSSDKIIDVFSVDSSIFHF